ncbi:MAG: YegS/Rv2252/BmrU family lipid kinase [Candidatus Krumholzibacteriia bacterium]
MLTHLLIVNPHAGRGLGSKRRRQAERCLDTAGLAYEVYLTSGPGDARRVAEEEASRYSVIVAMGGDGTIQEVAGGLAAARLARGAAEGPPLAALGILPAGTGNDLIKSLRLPAELDAACRTLVAGRRRDLDLGRIRWRLASAEGARERIFVNNVGLGFEGQVGWEAYHLRTPLRGMPLYLLALLRVLPRLVNPPMALTIDGEARPPQPALLLSVGNGHTSGGGFKLNPGANPFDGKFDYCLADARGKLEVLRLLPRGMKGRHLGLAGVHSGRAERIAVTSARPFHGHADGELLGEDVVEATLELLPGLLPTIC